ncbi:MAG: FAD binding domain-containing protein [Burkholderiaceae bacterium]
MTSKRRVLIVGGSVGGLFAGLALLKQGWDVQVYERVPAELASRGAGIVTHQALFDALHAVGITDLSSLGVSVPGRVTFASDGSVIGRADRPQVLTAWGRLYQMLRDAFPDDCYHGGVEMLEFSASDSGVQASFSNGQSESANLLIAADGIYSRVRQQLMPEIQPLYAGYVCWRGLVPENLLSEQALSELFPFFGFTLPRGEQVLGYPVAGEANDVRPGHRRYNLVWYRPADEQTVLVDLLTDREGQMNGSSIAPNLIRTEVIDAMRQDARSSLSPQFLEMVDKCPEPFLQPIYDLAVEKMVHGRVVVMGDAAFVARPHVGMGVTKAADDAMALAAALGSGDVSASALSDFDRERVAVGRFVVDRARKLGAYMQAQIKTAAERQQAETFRTPEAVMAETASSDFLKDFSL